MRWLCRSTSTGGVRRVGLFCSRARARAAQLSISLLTNSGHGRYEEALSGELQPLPLGVGRGFSPGLLNGRTGGEDASIFRASIDG